MLYQSDYLNRGKQKGEKQLFNWNQQYKAIIILNCLQSAKKQIVVNLFKY